MLKKQGLLLNFRSMFTSVTDSVTDVIEKTPRRVVVCAIKEEFRENYEYEGIFCGIGVY